MTDSEQRVEWKPMPNLMQVAWHKAGKPVHPNGDINFYRMADLREHRKRLKKRLHSDGHLPRIQRDPKPLGYIEILPMKTYPKGDDND